MLRVINDILLSSCFLKVMHQKTLVKCRRSYKVRITVYIYIYIYKHLKNLPDTSSQIFDWKQFTRHSFSLFGGISFSRERMFYESNESMSHESRVNESMSQIWKNKRFGFGYLICLLASLLPDARPISDMKSQPGLFVSSILAPAATTTRMPRKIAFPDTLQEPFKPSENPCY